MEYICGKKTGQLALVTLAVGLQNYAATWLDLGTGDGRYVAHLARKNPDYLVIGLDSCRENLVEVSRQAPSNALFLIANAENLPEELAGQVQKLTINFPWGSLLRGLLTPSSAVMKNIRKVASAEATLEIRLNRSALLKENLDLVSGQEKALETLSQNGFQAIESGCLETGDLKTFPSSWARRLGSGMEGQALYLKARLIKTTEVESFQSLTGCLP